MTHGDFELIGGQEHRTIEIVPYNPTWPATFAAHGARIAHALGTRALRVEHIGSTSVPGLAAKPIVDIQLSVEDLEPEERYLPQLRSSGYELRVREPGHRLVRTPTRDIHVHICRADGEWERQHLLFRDWLQHSAEDRDLYAAAKRELARRDWPDMNAYAAAKSTVISEITARAQAWHHTRDHAPTSNT
ncbi:MAG: hypothetical protein JWO02_1598 [Solirubrobacterales bacterium]|nr:hypothetical protein [Solirubrobacterales bacterium]